MVSIEVLGSGCSKCETLYRNTEQAARELGIIYQIKKVTDIGLIVGYGIMTTPALVVNGEVKFSGRVPSPEQLKGFLS